MVHMPPLLTRLDLRGVSGDLRGVLPSLDMADEGPVRAVQSILAEVKRDGDRALRSLTSRFDAVDIGDIRVPDEELKASLARLDAPLRRALEVARDNIEAYHRTQLHPDTSYAAEGISVKEVRVPVDGAGLYAPGGRAPLASSVLMTAVPARVAGVPRLALCSPPGSDGRVAPTILAAAALAGVNEVYRVGGAQAIAALAYGTESIVPVDVIVGPGNRYVALAERLVAEQGAVGVPSAFTGPSEVAVVADETTPVDFAAIDLVVQAEHGPDGLAYLLTWSEQAARAIAEAVERFTSVSPRRAEVEATLRRGGFVVMVEGPEQAVAVANALAAEHLELMTEDAASLVEQVRSAGAVFVGPWAPASVGDYAAGPNHVLPTARSARFSSALRVDDFCKFIHVVSVAEPGLARLTPHVAEIARSEGLASHAESVLIRRARGAW